tara:strand:- start:108 stop:650 length:543 start_codon:yes stop_codon:yes gene_type:complete
MYKLNVKEHFEENTFYYNCNYKKINSFPIEISLNKNLNSYIQEISNKELLQILRKNLLTQKPNTKIYQYKIIDKFELNNFYSIISYKFQKIIQNINKIKDFKIINLYINHLYKPTFDKSKHYLIDFDVLLYRKNKFHGKHINIKAKINNLYKITDKNFDLNIYSIMILGIVFEDKIILLN